MDTETLKKIGISIVIIILVVGLGVFAVNQTLQYFYRSQFLQDPCGLCKKLNQTNQPQYIYSLPEINLSQEINFTGQN